MRVKHVRRRTPECCSRIAVFRRIRRITRSKSWRLAFPLINTRNVDIGCCGVVYILVALLKKFSRVQNTDSRGDRYTDWKFRRPSTALLRTSRLENVSNSNSFPDGFISELFRIQINLVNNVSLVWNTYTYRIDKSLNVCRKTRVWITNNCGNT